MIISSWLIQACLATASLLMLIPYYVAFKGGHEQYMADKLDMAGNSKYKSMYYSGFLISMIWYVMPFLEQPRLRLNIFSLFSNKELLIENSIYCMAFIAFILYFMFAWGTVVVKRNLSATKDRFLHPSELITDGPYAKVRNPMIIGDLFGHLGFILLLGGIHTLCFYIIYICINVAIVYIENKYSICVHFKDEYAEYAKRTPAFMNRELWIFALVYFVLIIINIVLTIVHT